MQEKPISDDEPQPPFTGTYAVAPVASVIGILSLLAFDFAGWYERVPYGPQPIERWHYVGLFESPLQFIGLAIPVVALGYTAYVAYTVLKLKRAPTFQRAMWTMVAASLPPVFVILTALVFILTTVFDEPDDWWLDTGFYGGFLASCLNTIMFSRALSSVAKPIRGDQAR